MDKEKKKPRRALSENLILSLRGEMRKRKRDRGSLLCDVGVFLIAFFLARRHTVFGAYPLGVGFMAALPYRTIMAFFGVVCGSLSMGRSGVIHATVALIVLLLRFIISASVSQRKEVALFSEPLIMRICSVGIGSLIGAGYEMLLTRFSFASVLFCVFGVIASVSFTAISSGLFSLEISAADFLFGDRSIIGKKEERERPRVAFFQFSFALVCAAIVFSFEEYSYFGISVAYSFASALTLFISKRFGAVRGCAVGFICTVAISPIYSPAFALMGVSAGLLFPFGIAYAVLGAGILFVGWGAYISGMNGFLSLLPEYILSSTLIFVPLRRAATERGRETTKETSETRIAAEMVGAYWLSEKSRSCFSSELSDALSTASEGIREFSRMDGTPDFEEYRRIVTREFEKRGLTPGDEIINKISTKLYKKQRIGEIERAEIMKTGMGNDGISEMCARSASYERGLYEKRRVAALAEQYEIISRMISENESAEHRKRGEDVELSGRAKDIFTRHGFPEGDIRVFGSEKRTVVGAGYDPDGKLITSPVFKEALADSLGMALGEYEYFRKGDMALFKCVSVPMFKVAFASVSDNGPGTEISGDRAEFFTAKDYFYSVISDGMGSGKEARESADFVTRYLSDMLISNVGIQSATSALNQIIRHKGAECTATLDLFKLSLIDGEAIFIKSGAAPSYVKRDKSIFRIRSETAPIGLLKSVDAEKIKVEIKRGDYVIMLSDGVSMSVEDSAWLITYLTADVKGDVQKYAEDILSLARKNSKLRDDMTVSVMKILASDENP